MRDRGNHYRVTPYVVLFLAVLLVACMAIAVVKNQGNAVIDVGAGFDCQITFIHPDDGSSGIRTGIFDIESGGMSRCGTLEERCLIQQGLKEPVAGSFRMMEYSWNCTWENETKSCVCRV